MPKKSRKRTIKKKKKIIKSRINRIINKTIHKIKSKIMKMSQTKKRIMNNRISLNSKRAKISYYLTNRSKNHTNSKIQMQRKGFKS